VSNQDVKIKVSLDGANTVQSGLKGIGDGAGSADGKLGKLASKGLKGVAVGAGVAAGAFLVFAGASFKALANIERLNAQTEAVLASTDGLAGRSIDDILGLADSLEKLTGVEAEAIQEGQNLLLTFTQIRGDNFDAATKAALDLSVAMGKDMASSATLVGKALNDPIAGVSALSRVGVQLTEDQKNLIKSMVEAGDVAGAQGVILAELNTQFGGSAEAFGNTFEGALAKAKNSVGTLGEALVSGFLPVATDVLIRANDLFLGLAESPAFQAIVDRTAAMVQGVVNGTIGFAEIGTGIQNGIQAAAEWITSGGITTIVEAIISGRAAFFQAALKVFPALVEGLVTVLPTLLSGVVQLVVSLAQLLITSAPVLLQGAIQLFQGLVDGILAALPYIISTVTTLVPVIVSTLVSMIPILISGAIQLFQALLTAIPVVITQLVGALPTIITAIVNGITTAIPMLVQAGIALLTSLIAALPIIIESIVAALPVIITAIITALTNAIPLLIESGIQLFIALISALPTIISTIIGAIPTIIGSVLGALTGAIPQLIMMGVKVFTALVSNMPAILGGLLGAVGQITGAIFGAIGNFVGEMVKAGGNLVRGLWEGISGAAGWLMRQISGFVDDVVGNIAGFFGIASPSKRLRDEVGQHLPSGIGAGVAESEDKAIKPLRQLNTKLMDEAKSLNLEAMFKTEASLTQQLVPMRATATAPGPINVEAAIDSRALAAAVNEAFSSSASDEQSAVTLSRESINQLASVIVDSVRVQSRQGVSVLG
jgi:phage-related protein